MPSAFKLLSPAPRGDANRTSSKVQNAPATFRVLVSDRSPAHRVRYVDQLIGDDSAGGAPDDIEFDFRGNPLGTYDVDVVHLTSASAVTGGDRVPEREQIRRASRFTKALKRRRIALVRTVYGEESARARAGSRAEMLIDHSTTSYVVLSPTTAAPNDRSAAVIRHSHLRGRFLGYPRAHAIRGRLLFVSSGAFHTAYEGPLKVFAVADLEGYTLRLVGKVPPGLADSFARTLARRPATISLRDEALSDAARIEEITKAELVVVASPDSYETLSIIILALSLDRPVLVQATPGTRLLADEVGHEWVRLHGGPLTATALEAAVRHLEAAPPTGQPNLDARDPNVIAAQYADVYRAAAASR